MASETAETAMLTIEAVMEKLSLSRAEVYRQVKDGKIKSKKENQALLFAESDVGEFASKRDADKTELQDAAERWLTLLQEAQADIDSAGAEPTEEKESETPSDPEADAGGSNDGEPTHPDMDTMIGELAGRLIKEGIRTGMTDIYLDPLSKGDRVLFRQGEAVTEFGRFEACLGTPLRDAFRALAKLSDTDDPSPKGFVEVETAGESHQVLIEISPTLLGVHVHLHLWGASSRQFDLAKLGYLPDQAKRLNQLLGGPPGLVLIARGGGIVDDAHHAELGRIIADQGKLVVSIESGQFPQSEHLVQIGVDRAEEGNFPRALDTALRMDPDVLMIDQIAGKTDAQALFENLSAGGLVIAGIRAQDMHDACHRLLTYEIHPDQLAPWLTAGIERIMLRRLCPDCRQVREAEETERSALRLDPDQKVYEPVGCDRCHDGYFTRRAVLGIWPPDDTVRLTITEGRVEGLRQLEGDTYGIGAALQQLAVAGDVSIGDAQILIARYKKKDT